MLEAAFPPPIGAGDRVGVAALSGPVDPTRSKPGWALCCAPCWAANLARKVGLFAADAERLDDASIKAIFFARGGHGSYDLLPAEPLARHPRAYLGY